MLDTSAAIEMLRGQEPPREVKNIPFTIGTVVEMELWAGVYHRGGDAERKKVEALLRLGTVVTFDRDAAHEAAKVLAELEAEGLRIGDFDSQIAGHARSLGFSLLTANERHFRRVRGLQVVSWQVGA